MSEPQTMIENMLVMQHDFNQKVHPEYYRQGYRWDVAIIRALSEVTDHLHWECWKNTDKPADVEEARMKIVDVWHFLMSYITLSVFSHSESGEILEQSIHDRMHTLSFAIVSLLPSDFVQGYPRAAFGKEDVLMVLLRMIHAITNTAGMAMPWIRAYDILLENYGRLCLAAGITDIQMLYKLYKGSAANSIYLPGPGSAHEKPDLQGYQRAFTHTPVLIEKGAGIAWPCHGSGQGVYPPVLSRCLRPLARWLVRHPKAARLLRRPLDRLVRNQQWP